MLIFTSLQTNLGVSTFSTNVDEWCHCWGVCRKGTWRHTVDWSEASAFIRPVIKDYGSNEGIMD